MTDLPTTRQELDRKTIETLEQLYSRRNNKEISDGQLEIAVEAIFGCVSGMVSEDVIDLLSSVRHDAKPAENVRRLFINEANKIAMLECVGDTLWVKTLPRPSGDWLNATSKCFGETTFPKKGAFDATEQMAAKLVAGGWRELS